MLMSEFYAGDDEEEKRRSRDLLSSSPPSSQRTIICEEADSGWLKEVIKLIVKTFCAGKVFNFAPL